MRAYKPRGTQGLTKVRRGNAAPGGGDGGAYRVGLGWHTACALWLTTPRTECMRSLAGSRRWRENQPMAAFDTPQEEAACTMLKQVLQNHIATYNLSFISLVIVITGLLGDRCKRFCEA